MKLTKSLLAACTAALALTACTDNDGENYLNYTGTFEEFANSSSIVFNENGYWDGVYNTDENYNYFSDGYAYFSHEATYWADWNYYSWYGFCPSIASETQDVTSDDITAHQWSSASGSGCNNSSVYILGYWNVSETLTESTGEIPASPTLKIQLISKGTPTSVYLNNSNYGYWAMKNGTYYNAAFDNDSWFKVTFYGVSDSQITGQVDSYLAQNGDITKEWKAVDLSALGTVDYIYIQLSSSDTGSWGMNNPAYICLDNLSVHFEY